LRVGRFGFLVWQDVCEIQYPAWYGTPAPNIAQGARVNRSGVIFQLISSIPAFFLLAYRHVFRTIAPGRHAVGRLKTGLTFSDKNQQLFTCGNPNWYILLTFMFFPIEGGRPRTGGDQFARL
jgi:hypothetical protein